MMAKCCEWMDGTRFLNSPEVFRRPRPVVPHPEDATCRPDLAKKFDRFASYPSGHTTMAWALALALTSVAPGDPVPVLKLGYSAGDSRAICGAHWQSDVEAGRELAAAVFARIMGDPDYLAAAEPRGTPETLETGAVFGPLNSRRKKPQRGAEPLLFFLLTAVMPAVPRPARSTVKGAGAR